MNDTDSMLASVLQNFGDEFSARRRSFDPQGDTGGPFHIEGRTGDGRPARMRSEAAEYERNRRAIPRPYSIIGELLHPEQASLVDAIRRNHLHQMQATGYDYRDFPR